MSLNRKLEGLTIKNADIDMEAPPPKETPAQLQDVFTFVTVYHKHGESSNKVFNTLQEGLLKFVDLTAPKSEKEGLVLIDDEKLTDRLFEIGMYAHGSKFLAMYAKGAGGNVLKRY